MSTKTTLKRIALVAVSALGFGLMTSVAPASAGTVYTTSISVSTNKAPVAGANGTVVTHTVRFLSSTTGSSLVVTPHATLTSKPSGSSLALQAEGDTTSTPVAKAEFDNGATPTTNASEDYWQTTTHETVPLASESGYANYTALAYLHAYYDVPGTYVWTIWDDSDTANGVLNGTEVSTTVTVVVGGTGSTQTYKATTTTWGASSVTSGTNGALVRIALQDSAGNATSPDTAGGVKVTLSGSAKVDRVNDGNVDNVSSYTLGNGDFDGDGYAWVNVTNTVSETAVLTLSGSGSMASSFTAPASVALTFTAEVASDTAAVIGLGAASGLKITTAATATADGSGVTANKNSTSITFRTGKSAATAAKKDHVIITDTDGVITGLAAADYDILVTEGTTGCTYCGTFSVSGINFGGLTGKSFDVTNKNGFGLTVVSATAEATTVTVLSADSIKAAAGATNTFAVEVDDQFGAAMSGVALSASVAGRNSTVNVASAITNADGVASITYKDASTSTTSLVDTVTFTSNSKTDTATVTYTSATNFGAGSILLTTAVTKSTGADADVLTSMYWDITAGKAGPTEGKKAVTATVKDANSVVLSGVPVTFSVTGTGCAITEPTKTVYTGAAGTVSANVYAWLEGKCVVTGTVGTISDDVNTYWNQVTAGETRSYTATSSSPRVVVVTAKDRFGNNVSGASFKGTIIGDGFFGTGTNVATGETGTDGTMRFVTLESTADVTVRVTINDTTNYQADASKGLVSSNTATDLFTVAAAGTALTEETGVGVTFDAAGTLVANPNGLDVVIKGAPSAATVAAEAASDAAAEAIDAANAATDAANLAAEAADAATVAAEEARDAADAATAAIEELATQVATLMAALQAQVKTLANTVAKIAKKVRA